MCKNSDFIHCDHGLYLDIVYLQRENRKWQMRDDLIHKLAYSHFFFAAALLIKYRQMTEYLKMASALVLW